MARFRVFTIIFVILSLLASACSSGEDQPVPAEKDAEEAVFEFDLENLPDHPLVVMTTTKGDITLELDNVNAPISTKNFLRYAQSGHYDGTIFHRVDSDFMIQGGGFTESLYANPHSRPKTPRDPIRNEADNGLKNRRGALAMARLPRVHSG